jgi:hypothetical protein
MKYIKSSKKINEEEFLLKAKKIKSFSSSLGKKYVVTHIKDDDISFKRADAKNPDKEWSFDLKKVFEAFENLSDFKTESFRKICSNKALSGERFINSLRAFD